MTYCVVFDMDPPHSMCVCVSNLVDSDFVCIVSITGSESAEILGCSFRNNSGISGGGALAVGRTNRTDVIRCNFENNAVRDRDGVGGSIQFGFGLFSSRSGDVALVSESNFTNSFAGFDAGAIRSQFRGNVTVEGSTFTNCTSRRGAACT